MGGLIKLPFSAAKVSRPLAAICKLIKKGGLKKPPF
jgi:hypothetical protein